MLRGGVGGNDIVESVGCGSVLGESVVGGSVLEEQIGGNVCGASLSCGVGVGGNDTGESPTQSGGNDGEEDDGVGVSGGNVSPEGDETPLVLSKRVLEGDETE